MERGPVARDLRQRNRARVLRHMLRTKESTRARIATDCRISVASAANVVADLIHEGLVHENGYLPSAGGRPTVTLSIVRDAAYVIGVAVGELGVTAGLFDLQFSPLDRVFTRVRDRAGNPQPVATAVLEGISVLRSRHPEIEKKLLGVGLGLPGIVDLDDRHGPVIYAQSLGWPPVRLSELFADSGLTVYADNGAKTQTMSEFWFGAAQGISHGLVALIGHGIGMGVISRGRLLRGASSSAGEWGHTKISLDGPECHCGATGCLESYVGAYAIKRRWREAGGQVLDDEEQTLMALLSQAEEGDPVARAVTQETIQILGAGLGNLVNLFNPERIVIGGWVGQLIVANHLDELHEQVRVNALDRPGKQFDLVPSKLGADSVSLGAALLSVESLIEGTQDRGAVVLANHQRLA